VDPNDHSETPVNNTENTNVKTILNQSSCNLKSDQTGSLNPPLPKKPMKVQIDLTFNFEQRELIKKAINTWNDFTQKNLGEPFFEASENPMPTYAVNGNPSKCDQLQVSKDTLPIVAVSSTSRWTALGMDSSVPAVTMRCIQEGEVLQEIIYVNTSLTPIKQLQSIVLHEIGHAMGLAHSCDEQNQDLDSYLNCNKIPSIHSYRDAVMFPTLKSSLAATGAPEIKEDLRINDKERAICRYDSTFSPK
jgi:hypothetical protein